MIKHACTIKISSQCSQRWLNSLLQEGPPHILGNSLVHVTVYTPLQLHTERACTTTGHSSKHLSPADHLASLTVSITACLRRGCRGAWPETGDSSLRDLGPGSTAYLSCSALVFAGQAFNFSAYYKGGTCL